jgi:hypothetical protein
LAGFIASGELASSDPCEAAKGETVAMNKTNPSQTQDFFKGGFLAIGFLPPFTSLTISLHHGMQSIPRTGRITEIILLNTRFYDC